MFFFLVFGYVRSVTRCTVSCSLGIALVVWLVQAGSYLYVAVTRSMRPVIFCAFTMRL